MKNLKSVNVETLSNSSKHFSLGRFSATAKFKGNGTFAFDFGNQLGLNCNKEFSATESETEFKRAVTELVSSVFA